MKNPNTLRKAALVVALAAITATAWAASETLAPSGNPAQARPVWTELESSEAMPAEPLAPQDSLAPNEAVVRPDDSVLDSTPPAVPQAAPVAAVPAPAVERTAQASITIEERRLTLDERIQGDVMDRIAQGQNVSGKIGVETHDAMVTLTGYTSTAGQAYRVGREARGIAGVKGVDNQIRPRIGGSV